MTLLAILTKLVGSGLGARLSHYTLKDSYVVGAGMVSRGEMALIIARLVLLQINWCRILLRSHNGYHSNDGVSTIFTETRFFAEI